MNKSVTAGYDGSSACIYTAPGTEGKQTILRFMAGERSDFDYNKENGTGTPFDVPGIGDAAACETDTDRPRLNFYSSKAKQVVTVTGESCDIDKQFAQKAVSRL